jgi:hypothetical protein
MHYSPVLNVNPLVYWIAKGLLLITLQIALEAVAQNVVELDIICQSVFCG